MPKTAPKTTAKKIDIPKKLSPQERDQLLVTLQERFTANMQRHKGIKWTAVEKKLTPKKLLTLYAMEITGGQPDLVTIKKGQLSFVDCSPESPAGRRSTCYDKAARTARKKFPPKNDALSLAKEIGIEMLTEEQYRALQELGEFDIKTSSWILTPPQIRTLGGALFADRRYETIFVYHNGADSYYGARAFRGLVQL